MDKSNYFIYIAVFIIIVLIYIFSKKKGHCKIFQINDNYKIIKRTKDIIIIDNFYKYPNKISSYAFKNKDKFVIHDSIYKNKVFNPKLHYDNSTEFINFFENILGKPISKKAWNWSADNGSNGWLQYNTNNIKPIIHSDNSILEGPGPKTNWGVVVYLKKNPNINSGTGFYKHIATNFKKIPEKDYFDNLKSKTKILMKSYLESDDKENSTSKKFKKYYECYNVYNRILIFNASLFHCGLNSYGNDITNSRFFQTFFIKTQLGG